MEQAGEPRPGRTSPSGLLRKPTPSWALWGLQASEGAPGVQGFCPARGFLPSLPGLCSLWWGARLPPPQVSTHLAASPIKGKWEAAKSVCALTARSSFPGLSGESPSLPPVLCLASIIFVGPSEFWLCERGREKLPTLCTM